MSRVAVSRVRSADRGDDMGLHLALHRPVAKSLGQRCSGGFGDFIETAGAVRFDLNAERRALAEAKRRFAWRRGAAELFHRLDIDLREPDGLEDGTNLGLGMVAVRRSRQEPRRVVRKESSHRFGDDVRELVLLDPVSDVEEESPARLQHSPRLAKRGLLVGKEHDAELTDNGVELFVLKRQGHGIGLLPCDGPSFQPRRGEIEHRLVKIGRKDGDALGKSSGEGARHGAGPRGDFENAPSGEVAQPRGQVGSVWLEDHRDEIPIVQRWDRPGENFVDLCHGGTSRGED